MSYLRHMHRHAHKTMADYLRSELTGQGWIGGSPPFGATAVTFMEIQPEENGIAPVKNTVAVTLGNETPFTEMELGGGLTSIGMDLYVDIYGEDLSTAVAIASDLRDSLTWLSLPLRDYSADPHGAETEIMLVLDDVFVDTPPAAVGRGDKRFWRVVNATVSAEFVDSRGQSSQTAAASCSVTTDMACAAA